MKHLNFFQGHFKKIRNKYDKYFVSDILKKYHVHNFKINDDLTVDTSGDVNFSRVIVGIKHRINKLNHYGIV